MPPFIVALVFGDPYPLIIHPVSPFPHTAPIIPGMYIPRRGKAEQDRHRGNMPVEATLFWAHVCGSLASNFTTWTQAPANPQSLKPTAPEFTCYRSSEHKELATAAKAPEAGTLKLCKPAVGLAESLGCRFKPRWRPYGSGRGREGVGWVHVMFRSTRRHAFILQHTDPLQLLQQAAEGGAAQGLAQAADEDTLVVILILVAGSSAVRATNRGCTGGWQ